MNERKLEGSGFAQLHQMIKRVGHNNDYTIEFATVTKALPDLEIKVDGMPINLPKEFLVLTDSLFQKGLNVGDRILVSSINDGQTFLLFDKVVVL